MKKYFPYILICLAVVLVFLNSLPNTFHLDDHYLIKTNAEIRKVQPIWRHFVDYTTISSLDRITQFRPLLPLTLSINYYFTGNSPYGFHFGNILLHLLCTLILFLLLKEILGHWNHEKTKYSKNTSLFTALIFGVHPVSGFPVNYLSSRDLILMTLFMFASLLIYIKMRRTKFSILGWLFCLLFLLLSLLSKTNAIAVPLIVIFFELTLGKNKFLSFKTYLTSLPFILVIALQLVYKRYFLGFSDFKNGVSQGISSFQYAITQSKFHLFEYVKNFFWPFQIRLMPKEVLATSVTDFEVIIGSIFIISTLILAFRFLKTKPLISFSILSYWGLLGLTSSIIPLFYSLAHYRPYSSSPFFYLLIVLSLSKLCQERLFNFLCCCLLIYFGAASHFLNKTWRTGESAWTHSIKYGGDHLAHLNLAMAIPDRKDPRVLKNLQEALKLKPEAVIPNINLGLFLIDNNEPKKGIRLVEKAVNIRPDWGNSYYWLAIAYEKIGEKKKALDSILRGAKLTTQDIQIQYKAAELLQRENRHEESLKHLSIVRTKDKWYKETLFLEAFANQMLGNRNKAIGIYEEFLSKRTDYMQAYFNLGIAYLNEKKYDKAIFNFEKTLKLKPDYYAAFLHLSNCYKEMGDVKKSFELKSKYEKSKKR